MSGVKNIQNIRFGRLTAVKYLGDSKWECVCDCGIVKSIYGHSLRSGHTKSCGCYCKEVTSKSMKQHGMYRSKEYKAWQMIRDRCSNKKYTGYKDYGGRGIKVCARWLTFENFYNDMGSIGKGLSIERIDVNGDYEPSNCKWATSKEQQRNRRNNKNIAYKGVVKCLAEWCEDLDLVYGRTLARINRLHWTIERAFEAPLRGIM